MIANLGEAARADSFHNRCSGSQNFICRFATILFLSSLGWTKSAAGASNLIVADKFSPVSILVFGRIIDLHVLQPITNLERLLSSPDSQRAKQFPIDGSSDR
jgi:hypothetical protein